jgi:hypothetical protein
VGPRQIQLPRAPDDFGIPAIRIIRQKINIPIKRSLDQVLADQLSHGLPDGSAFEAADSCQSGCIGVFRMDVTGTIYALAIPGGILPVLGF